jgi:spermidine synthase
LVLEQELAAGPRARQNFDVLALDAFSSDSIPVHLLTREAFEVYLQHLAPDGVIAAHISNRHVDLRPVLRQVAQTFELQAAILDIPASEAEPATFNSWWVLLTRNPTFLNQPAIAAQAQSFEGVPATRLWTDDYSNLVQMLK